MFAGYSLIILLMLGRSCTVSRLSKKFMQKQGWCKWWDSAVHVTKTQRSTNRAKSAVRLWKSAFFFSFLLSSRAIIVTQSLSSVLSVFILFRKFRHAQSSICQERQLDAQRMNGWFGEQMTRWSFLIVVMWRSQADVGLQESQTQSCESRWMCVELEKHNFYKQTPAPWLWKMKTCAHHSLFFGPGPLPRSRVVLRRPMSL